MKIMKLIQPVAVSFANQLCSPERLLKTHGDPLEIVVKVPNLESILCN